jgi:hypothetical protein
MCLQGLTSQLQRSGPDPWGEPALVPVGDGAAVALDAGNR